MYTTQNSSSAHRGKKEGFFNALFRMGVFDFLHKLNPDKVTVLNYHRIDDTTRDDFDSFKPNVSASPKLFAEQMGYLKGRFNVISEGDMTDWLDRKKKLPPHALLITFDDGYTDVLENAYPILHQYGFSALIFLATNYVGTKKPFYWDVVAYCFKHTRLDCVNDPLVGELHWGNENERDHAIHQFMEAVKLLDEKTKNSVIERLPELMGVSLPASLFADLILGWDQIRFLSENGIGFGAHTVSHAILTRIPLESARVELSESKIIIEREIKKAVNSLAYPNGGQLDFNQDIEKLAGEIGFRFAFSLINGHTSTREIRESPFAIRRIYVGQKDVLPRFAAKLSGFTDLRTRLFHKY